ncbi:MAG: DMT family transporter [bacterium]
MFLVILEYLILASTFTIAKATLFYAKPFFIIGIRMTFAGILLLGFKYLTDKRSLTLYKSDWWLFLKASIFHIYLAFIPEFWALQYLTSAKTNLIYSATPFIAALLAYFIFAEKLTRQKTIGMFIGLLGLIPIFLTQTDPREGSMELFSFSLPELVLLGAVFSATYAWFIIKKLLIKGYSLVVINGVSMFVGGIFSLLTSFIFEGVKTNPVFDFWPFLFWVLFLILMANIISYNLYAWLIKHYSITFVTFAGFLCPVFGAFLGWFFLGEHISWHYYFALLCIAIGLYVFYKDEMKLKQELA